MDMVMSCGMAMAMAMAMETRSDTIQLADNINTNII